MSTIIFYFILQLLSATSAGNLNAIYNLRVKGDEFIKAKQPDSASHYFSKVIEDKIYADATDYLKLSSSLLQLKDTAGFKRHLVYSIEHGGADSSLVFTYFRSNNADNHSYFRLYFDSVFTGYRNTFLSTIDTAVQRELDDILFLDQMPRQGNITKTNLSHIREIGAYVDSVNYLRVVSLIERGKYPGFHNYGIMSSRYDVVLMHTTDHNEEHWNYIFEFLKKEVLKGNITPTQVVTIATRHYSTKFNCTYYGSVRRGATEICNCEKVDSYRAEIGLDNLKSEYSRLKMQLPDCYKN